MKFYADAYGVTFAPPSAKSIEKPNGLREKLGVFLNEIGQLIIDKSKMFKMQPGREPEEQYPESVLKV